MGKILVIDDDPLVLAVAVKRLRADGHQVVTAADGEAGLKLASAERPDVTLVDWLVQVCQQRGRNANYPFACFAAMEGQVVEL